MEQEEKQNKSIGEIIDELLNNPEVMIQQCGKVLKEAKEEAEKIIDKNKQLEEQIIEKDKGMEYLNGRIDGMEYIIEHLNLKMEDK
jgi:hypothetical protein